jgi:hypothetical protein
MLIEELIRVGRPLAEGGLGPEEILRIVTDVAETRAKNCFRNVLVAELPEDDRQGPAVWRVQLGDDLEHDEETTFVVHGDRAVGVPFSLPTGGNPVKAQGRYGPPVYPCWDPHLQGFRKSADAVREFLESRLERTPAFAVPPALLEALCRSIHETARQEFPDDSKRLGVLVLVRPALAGWYTLSQRATRYALGESRLHPGRFLEPNLPRLAEAIWAARLEEGAEMGQREEAACTISGEPGRVVSAYCKAWPWAFPTWTCPVGHAGDTDLLVEGIALSPAAYRALILGASWFNRVTQKVQSFVVQEVFAPASDGPGRELAQRRRSTDLDTIYGAALLLPLEDRFFLDPDARAMFASRVLGTLQPPSTDGPLARRQLVAVTGFDTFLPEDFERADFRLTLIYFSGEPSRGDIHLRACIQDVLPTVTGRLERLAVQTAREAGQLFESVYLAERRRAYLYECYKSVPYLLARGYGGSHLWGQLDRVLHRRPLGVGRLVANSGARMAGLAHRLPESRYDLAEEAIFYLLCRDFIRNCNAGLSTAPEEDGMPMRPWRELLSAVERGPIENLRYANAAELGFGCGALVRQFSAMYWNATKVGNEGKDYLKHRVLTFGADLSPDTVWKGALRQMFEVAKRYDELRGRFEGFLQERVGVTLTEFDRLQDEVRRNRDEFMTAFWAGYSLQGHDLRKKSKAETVEAAQSTGEENHRE